jgi:hypothetical protein
MSLRERRVPLDPFDILVRESLKERADGRLPEPEVRDELLARAERQERRMAQGPSLSLGELFGERPSRFGYSASPNHFICLEALFGPRASWFSFNQLTR